MNSNNRRGYWTAVAAALAWAATSPGLGYVIKTFHTSALTLAFWRDAFIALGMLGCYGIYAIISPKGRTALYVDRRALGGLAITGVISVGLYHALWLYSIVLNGAALAVVLIYTYPTFVTLGAWLVFGERISSRQVAALGVSFVGCALLARVYDSAALQVSWLGLVVGIGTGISHAGYVLSSQRAVATYSSWVTLTYTMVFGALTLLVLTLFTQGTAGITEVGAGAAPWLWIAALALGPTLMGYGLFTASLRWLPGRIASLVVLLEAPISSGLAVWLLGERLEPPQLVGILLVLSAAATPALDYLFPAARREPSLGG